MTERDLIKIFMDETYIKPLMRIYPTNKIVYNHIDEIWSVHLADFSDYKAINDKGYRYIYHI